MTEVSSSAPDHETYWTESRQPLISLVFILPMMLIYEAGVSFLGVRNGADVWMGNVLNLMGFRLHLFLPLALVGMLLGWHYLTRHRWRISPGVLSAMAVESLFLAICLRIVLSIQKVVMLNLKPSFAISGPFGEKVREAVGYLGAGIYEELLFRLILIAVVVGLVRLWIPDPKKSMVLAVLATSLMFSGAHYVGAAGDPFDSFSFVFRFLAGIFFAVLFVFRGFGITAGAHAMYDILVGIF